MLVAILISIGLLLMLGLAWVVMIFNKLTTLNNRRANAFSQIDVQLKRRHDLIPNLVETVKGYMAHEKQTLEAVIAARNDAVAARSMGAGNAAGGSLIALAAAESALGGALGGLMARVEAYPQLKADALAARLMEELSTTENRIAFARQAFNDSVMTFNSYRESFPQIAVAPIFGFQRADLFELQDAAQRQAPTVALS